MRRIKRTVTFAVATLVALATGMVLFLAPAASAQAGYPPPPEPPVVPPTLAPPPPTKVAGVAFTGANILRWVIIAAVLMAVGSLLVVVNRRRRVSVAA